MLPLNCRRLLCKEVQKKLAHCVSLATPSNPSPPWHPLPNPTAWSELSLCSGESSSGVYCRCGICRSSRLGQQLTRRDPSGAGARAPDKTFICHVYISRRCGSCRPAGRTCCQKPAGSVHQAICNACRWLLAVRADKAVRGSPSIHLMPENSQHCQLLQVVQLKQPLHRSSCTRGYRHLQAQ